MTREILGLSETQEGRNHQTKGIERDGMNVRSARRRRAMTFAVLGAFCLALGIRPQLIAVGHLGPHIWVREGDTVCLSYTQSMYGVPVEERFRVEGGRLFLFEVATTAAALEYLGLESSGADNVGRFLNDFSIPSGSVGGHILSAGGRRIALADVPAEDGRIRVRLTRRPLIVYLVLLW
jgi:hypothetical protein